MPNLPPIRFLDPPEWQRRRLLHWLAEWEIELRFPTFNTQMSHEREATTGEQISDAQRDQLQSVSRDYDMHCSAGQIRLLPRELLPDVPRPVYALILSEWEDDMFLIAPYAPFVEPATPGEFLTGRSDSALRVLSLWNSHTIPRSTLEKTWRVDELTSDERADAWNVFLHITSGEALAAHLIERVGVPVTHPLDPRLQYQSEQVAALAPLAAAAIIAVEQQQQAVGASTTQESPSDEMEPVEWLYPVFAWLALQQRRALAASVQRPPFRAKQRTIEGTNLILSIKTQPIGKMCKITILESGELSQKLDGVTFVPSRGKAVEIKSGKAVCPLRGIYPGGYKLIAKNGTRLKLRDIA